MIQFIFAIHSLGATRTLDVSWAWTVERALEEIARKEQLERLVLRYRATP